MRSHAAAVGLLAAAIVAPAPAPAQAAPAGELRVGSLALERCENGTRWWCGSLRRPLDPARPDGRRISVAFRLLPAFRPGERGPALVAVEGGPGYPSAGSRAEFTGIYGRSCAGATCCSSTTVARATPR